MGYHIGLDREHIRAEYVLMPGDPFRVPEIAVEVQKQYGGEIVELAWRREFRSMLVGNVLITSTGIGGPSAAIAMEELAMLGLRSYIRIGTTGAINEHVDVGDLIITSGAVRFDGASTHYAPIEYPAVAHHEVIAALAASASGLNIPYHIGITASTDTFYPGQERKDSYTGHLLRRFNGQTKELKNLNVLNYEMESATLLTIASVFGVRCGVIAGVVVNRCCSEKIDGIKTAESNAIKAGVGAVKLLC